LKRSTLFLLLAISWLIISTILLTLPGTDFPKEDWLDKIWFDKWVHIGMFSLLTWLWCCAFPEKNGITFYLLGSSCLLYGIIIEFVQRYFIVNRSFDIGDIIADAAGVTMGLLIFFRRYKKN
jgi:VanZ family protein